MDLEEIVVEKINGQWKLYYNTFSVMINWKRSKYNIIKKTVTSLSLFSYKHPCLIENGFKLKHVKPSWARRDALQLLQSAIEWKKNGEKGKMPRGPKYGKP